MTVVANRPPLDETVTQTGGRARSWARSYLAALAT